MKNILILLCLLPMFTQAQDSKDELIQWKDHPILSWADYKGKPDPNSGAAASTATYLAVEYSFKDGKLGYKITCSFSRSKSWGLHKNEHILAHEQGHFDIAEIFARKLYKKLTEYRFNKNRYQTDLQQIYQDITDAKEEMQNQYDRETNHSINNEKQAEWLDKIMKELKEFEAYAGY
jgi:hypothetical protein